MQITSDMAFLAFEISDNMSETPEGFLICHSVPVARTGVQHYYGRELHGVDVKSDEVYPVYRLAEDVFEEAALMSLEGKPVTDNHPDRAVTPDNAGVYVMGHGQNVGRQRNLVLTDLVVTNRGLIDKIRAGKRQVSLGYNCDYVPYKDGFRQKNIRINHIAVVDRGRAGPKVAIKDSESVTPPETVKSKGVFLMDKKKLQAQMFAAWAKDASPEDVLAAASMLTDDGAPAQQPAKKDDEGVVAKLMAMLLMRDSKATRDEESEEGDDDKKDTKDSALSKRVGKLEKGQEKILKALDALLKAQDEDGDEDEDKPTEDEESEEEETTEDEDSEEEESETKDSALDMKALKPIIAKLNAKDQKVVKDALRKASGKQSKGGAAAKIQKTVASKMAKDAEAKAEEMANKGQKWAEMYNPHYKKA